MEAAKPETQSAEGSSLGMIIIALACAVLAFTAYYIYQTKDIRAAKQAVERRLKDPYSVKYSGIEKCPFSNGIMGEYNAKNSWGAYAGSESFYYIDGHLTTIDDDDFSDMTDLCFHGRIRDQAERDKAFEEALGK